MSNFNFHYSLCFRIDQKAKMVLTFGTFGELGNFGKKFKPLTIILFFIFVWIHAYLKNCEIWTIYFLTKAVLESIKWTYAQGMYHFGMGQVWAICWFHRICVLLFWFWTVILNIFACIFFGQTLCIQQIFFVKIWILSENKVYQSFFLS